MVVDQQDGSKSSNWVTSVFYLLPAHDVYLPVQLAGEAFHTRIKTFFGGLPSTSYE